MVFPQHLTVRALQLHLHVQQVPIQQIQTLQHIHCTFPVSQARIYENLLRGGPIPTVDEVHGLPVPSTPFYTLKNFEQMC